MATASFDPSTMATQLATLYTQDLRKLLSTQSTNAQNTATALTTLQSALSTFDTALSGLSAKKGLISHSASFDTSGYATATATSAAQAGTYALFVSQVAAANQVAYDLTAASVPVSAASSAGTLTLSASGSSFSVALSSAADTDGDGSLSVSEIARAINNASGNSGLINASVATANGASQLILSAGKTGANSAITLDTSAVTNASLTSALSAGTTLATGQDAVVYLGGTGGIKMQQASNTFTNITGVSVTVAKAQAVGDTPLTLTVASDTSGTATNVQTFVDAYNTLHDALAKLTASANSSNGTAAGVFANDAGVRSLQDRLAMLVRQQSSSGATLATYGVTIDRYGKMSLNQTKLTSALSTNPSGLDTLFGSTSASSTSGILGSLDTYLKTWTNSVSGQITKRQNSVQTIQKSITSRQTELDTRYNNAYQNYLKQFTALQAMQSQMNDTSNMFSSLSSS